MCVFNNRFAKSEYSVKIHIEEHVQKKGRVNVSSTIASYRIIFTQMSIKFVNGNSSGLSP